MWKNVWNNDGIPKINIVLWLLAQNKLLTVENLSKRGFKGHFRCELCRQTLESSQHIFLECEYSKHVWHLVYLELTHKISWPSSCKFLVGKWGSAYKSSFYGKSVFQRTWKASSKFVCWHLWLARNKAIF